MLFSVLGTMLVVTGLVAAIGIVPPNGFCGVRLPWTRADETIWYRSNALAGELFMIWGGLMLSASRAATIWQISVLLLPGLVVLIVVPAYAALLFRERYGSCLPAPVPASMGRAVPTSVPLDLACLLLPVVVLFACLVVTGAHHGTRELTTAAFETTGGWTLLRRRVVAFCLYALVAVSLLTMVTRTFRTGKKMVQWTLFALRMGVGALFSSVALLMALRPLTWRDLFPYVVLPFSAVIVLSWFLYLREAVTTSFLDVPLRVGGGQADGAPAGVTGPSVDGTGSP